MREDGLVRGLLQRSSCPSDELFEDALNHPTGNTCQPTQSKTSLVPGGQASPWVLEDENDHIGEGI